MKSSQKKPYISFIVITWNSERFLNNCFTSIINKCNEEDVSFEVIVIDNGSQDGSIKVIKEYQNKLKSEFILIALDHNRGTTFTRNLGLRKASGEFLCILDSDTEMGEGRFSDLLKKLVTDKSIGIIAPRLLLPDGSVQPSVKKFPTMLNKLMKVPKILFGINTKNSDFYEDFPFTSEHEVNSAISACWVFRREIVDIIGYLDEKIFYSPEDIDYCLRIWKAGLLVLYYPSYTVLHHTQQITHKKPLSKTSISHFWGLIYYYRKHGGWFRRPQIR